MILGYKRSRLHTIWNQVQEITFAIDGFNIWKSIIFRQRTEELLIAEWSDESCFNQFTHVCTWFPLQHQGNHQRSAFGISFLLQQHHTNVDLNMTFTIEDGQSQQLSFSTFCYKTTGNNSCFVQVVELFFVSNSLLKIFLNWPEEFCSTNSESF